MHIDLMGGGSLIVPSFVDQIVVHIQSHAVVNSHAETVQAFFETELAFQPGGEVIGIDLWVWSSQAPVIASAWGDLLCQDRGAGEAQVVEKLDRKETRCWIGSRCGSGTSCFHHA